MKDLDLTNLEKLWATKDAYMLDQEAAQKFYRRLKKLRHATKWAERMFQVGLSVAAFAWLATMLTCVFGGCQGPSSWLSLLKVVVWVSISCSLLGLVAAIFLTMGERRHLKASVGVGEDVLQEVRLGLDKWSELQKGYTNTMRQIFWAIGKERRHQHLYTSAFWRMVVVELNAIFVDRQSTP